MQDNSDLVEDKLLRTASLRDNGTVPKTANTESGPYINKAVFVKAQSFFDVFFK